MACPTPSTRLLLSSSRTCHNNRAPIEATTIEAEQSKTTKKAKDPERSVPAKDFTGTS